MVAKKFIAGKEKSAKRQTDFDDNATGVPKNKKRALKRERQSHRKHYESVMRAKVIWNKLRLKTNEKKEVEELMVELMDIISGRMREISMQHDASRVVQAAVQYGNADQRSAILKELATAIPELSRIQYAHFVVLKLITYCCASGKEISNQNTILKALKGDIPKLAVHSVGARVVEVALSHLPNKDATTLRQELYGPHFTFFLASDKAISGSGTCSLKSFLEKHPDKKAITMKHVLGIIDKGVEKVLFGFAYFQHLLWEYAELSSPNEMRHLAATVAEHSIHMLSTRYGAKAVAQCAAYGTAKDRRRIMKSLKGYTRSSMLHRDAYLAILRLLDVTDDTVTVQKLLLAELTAAPDSKSEMNKEGEGRTSPLLELALSDTASKLILIILAGTSIGAAYFDPSELELLQPVTITENGHTLSTSKKDPVVRRRELSDYMKASLCELCLWHTAQLMRSISGSKVLREVYDTFPSDSLAVSIVDASSTVTTDVDEGGEDDSVNKETSMFEDPIGHKFLKNLLLAEANISKQCSGKRKGAAKESSPAIAESGISLARMIFDSYKGKLFDIASSNRGAFVLAALASVDALRSEVKEELKDKTKIIERKGETNKGYEALFNAILGEN